MNKNDKKNLYIYNLGSKFNLDSLEVVKCIYKIMNVNLKPVILNSSSIEIIAQKIDFSKAKNELKWMPKTNFFEGISKTIKWYKENYKNKL